MVDRARIQGWLEQLLHTHDTPGRTAFAFGLGVFLGFSPFLGLHAILGLILAFVLRLNRVVHAPYYALFFVGPPALMFDIWWNSRRSARPAEPATAA